LHIKDFAAKFQVSSDTVRYYEKAGLLSPGRSANGYRVYDEPCERDMQFIIVLKELGFSLEDINVFVEMEKQPGSMESNMQALHLFEGKLADVQQRMQFWKQAYSTLTAVHGLMVDGKCEENTPYIDGMIRDMYKEIQGGQKDEPKHYQS